MVQSSVALTSTPLPKGQPGLYEWSAGQPATAPLRLLNLLPPEHPGEVGAVASDATLGGFIGFRGDTETHAAGAVLDDGARVVWSTTEHLYLRDTARGETGETLRLDLPQGGSGAGQPSPVFQFASPDGSRVFFTDTQRLVAGSGKQGADLYECRIVEEPAGDACRLTDLTPETGGGESAQVQGAILGASEDGSSLYFVGAGALAAGGDPGQPNLYLYREGATRLIATLSAADAPDWAEKVDHTSRVSPNGRWLAFMSQESLTGYDNRDSDSGRPDQEVYLYRALAGEAGKLVCASCDPTGARPRGVEYANLDQGNGRDSLVGGETIWPEDTWIAANVPAPTPYRDDSALYQSRYLSNAGRLFFDSSDALVPGDSNGTEDVYEYEPAVGAGGGIESGEEEPPHDTCTTESPTGNVRSEGCVALISSGASAEESGFLDASENGDDVFFLTSAPLSPGDTDNAIDVYDARVGGGFPQSSPPPSCEGDACQNPIQAPDDPTPSSLVYQGAGNLLAPLAPPATKKTTNKPVKCKRGFVKNKKGKCVRKKSKKRAKKSSKLYRGGRS